MPKVIAKITAVAVALSAAIAYAAPKAGAPAWVLNPKDSYPESKYLAAVGYAPTRSDAEKKAMSALISVFGQKITASSSAVEHYSQAVKDGSIAVDKDFQVTENVEASFEYRLILGAEIKEAWYDGKDTYYALALMDKLKSSLAYGQMIEKNNASIKGLTSAAKADLDSYRRYALAIDIAEVNAQFVNILSVLSPAASAGSESVTVDALRAEQLKIAQGISFRVSVAGDRDDRIKSTLGSIVAAQGFKTGGDASSPYAVEAKISLSEVTLKGNDNKFSRYVLDVQVKDGDAVLLPFSDNGRSGQATLAEAEARSFRSAETAIKDKFQSAFVEYLTTYAIK